MYNEMLKEFEGHASDDMYRTNIELFMRADRKTHIPLLFSDGRKFIARAACYRRDRKLELAILIVIKH